MRGGGNESFRNKELTAGSWQRVIQILCMTSREIPAKTCNSSLLWAMNFRNFELLQWLKILSERRLYYTFPLLYSPPTSYSILQHKAGTCTQHRHKPNICKLCLSLEHPVVMSQKVKRKNITGTKVLSSVSCEVHKSYWLCTKANPVHFGEACLLEKQQDMIQ